MKKVVKSRSPGHSVTSDFAYLALYGWQRFGVHAKVRTLTGNYYIASEEKNLNRTFFLPLNMIWK